MGFVTMGENLDFDELSMAGTWMKQTRGRSRFMFSKMLYESPGGNQVDGLPAGFK